MDTAELAAIATDHRVRRTFAFIDLCGFTDFVDEHGDHGAVAELQTLRAAVREVAPLFGVRVEKWLGDGLMLVGVESEPLVGAALAIEQRHHRTGQLELRGGVASGDVILLEGDDYVGRAVNLASRLCDIAEPGSLLAATDDLELPEWVAEEAHAPVKVKGMADDVTVVTLSPDRRGAATEVAVAVRERAPRGGRRAHAADADLVPHRLIWPSRRATRRFSTVSVEEHGSTARAAPRRGRAAAVTDHGRRPRAVPPRPDARGRGRRRRPAVVGAASCSAPSASAPSSPPSA